MRFRYARVNPNAKCIGRAHPTDAGMDFYVPMDFQTVTLNPGDSVTIDSGIKVEVPFGFMGIFCNKSGIASKKNIIIGACIDKDSIILTNKGLFSCYSLTKEFVDYNKIEIMSYNENNKTFEYQKFDGFRISGHKKTIKLMFEGNITLICSEDHKILTKLGWKEAKDIDENDEMLKYL